MDIRGAHPARKLSDSALLKASLEACLCEQASLCIYLMSGICLKGHVVAYDDCSLLIKHGDQLSLLYQHMISTFFIETDRK